MGTHRRAAQRITAAIETFLASQAEDTTSRTTTAGSYGNLATGGAFTASIVVPASGWVRVDIRVTQRNSGANNTITSWRATGSSSGSKYTENDTAALIIAGTNNFPVSLFYLVTGLVPGETLTVTLLHRVNAGTGTVDYRQILLTGLP
ncbi:hypothetical protein ABZ605_08310 [Streptomyces sp. NPDC012765]|uniref:hypothetical protein n=1 Tax=Streptomyces sp. NPDC012765 TaxID=3155249 RepID=UPI00340F790A